jgi:hypothetical protein
MQLSLRPYVTTGVALVGATVIAAAPMQPVMPADIQISNPTVPVERAVELTANEIQDAVNGLILRGTGLGLTLTVPVTAAFIGALAPDLIPAGATAEDVATVLLLSLNGPLISGPGSIGTALQNIVDADGLSNILIATLLGAPSTIIDGFVNGGYGPDLAPLALDSLAALDSTGKLAVAIATAQALHLPLPKLLSGGLINEAATLLGGPNLGNGTCPGSAPACVQLPVKITLPGTLPTLQTTLEGLFASLGSSSSLLDGIPGLSSLTGSNLKTLAGDAKNLKANGLAGEDEGKLSITENNGGTGLDETNTDGPSATPKKHRHLINIDVFNPLGNLGGAKKDTKDNVRSLNSNDNNTPGRHRIGTPVRDLIHKVLSGGHDKDDNDEGTSDQPTDDAPK